MDVLKTPVRRKTASQQVKVPASPFMRKIGCGTGVAVYEMERSPIYCKYASPWAVKKLIQKQKNNVELNKRIKEEAEVLRRLNHPNIVAFKAFTKDSDGRNILVMEECTSCLGDMIEERSATYPAKTILKVLKDMASALDYLHNEALLIHCDVKSYNVLVKGDFATCKLCDFGICLPATKNGQIDLAKAGDEVEYVGTAAWSAPEILKFPQQVTTKADVYALGLVIWEMIALAPPVDEDFVCFNTPGGSFTVPSTTVAQSFSDIYCLTNGTVNYWAPIIDGTVNYWAPIIDGTVNALQGMLEHNLY